MTTRPSSQAPFVVALLAAVALGVLLLLPVTGSIDESRVTDVPEIDEVSCGSALMPADDGLAQDRGSTDNGLAAAACANARATRLVWAGALGAAGRVVAVVPLALPPRGTATENA